MVVVKKKTRRRQQEMAVEGTHDEVDIAVWSFNV